MTRCAAVILLLTVPFTAYPQQNEHSVTPEGAIYRIATGAVFRVEAGLGHGSGFLVDAAGLVITNDHVIGTAQRAVSVYIDSITRLQAIVLARDPDADWQSCK
jgi:S1-C subfamily serine protease